MGQFHLSFFRSLTQALESHWIFAKIDSFLLPEFLRYVIHNPLVKVIPSKMSVAVRGFHLKDPITKFQDGDIKSATAEVEDRNLDVLILLVKSVCKCGSRWLINDAFDIQSGNLAGFFGSLALGIVEVCRYRYHGISELLAKVIFCGLFHFLKDHRTNLRWGVDSVTHFNTGSVVITFYDFEWNHLHFLSHFVVEAAHKTLYGRHGVLGISNGLALCSLTHQSLAALRKGNDGRSSPPALGVGNNDRVISLHHSHNGVGRSQVDSNNLTHVRILLSC